MLDELARVAAATGGGVALAFIVMLGLGIVTLWIVYLSSAVVVLDRFARVSRRRSARVIAGGAIALLVSGIAWSALSPPLASAPFADRAARGLALFAATAAATAVLIRAVGRALRDLAPERLAFATALLLGLGTALAAAGTGLVLLPASLALPPLVYWAAVRIRRRRTAGGPRRDEDLARRLAALCALAAGLALLPAPVPAALGRAGEIVLVALAAAVALGLLPRAAAGFADMRGSAEWFIAARYLVAKRRQIFISAITAICVVGIAAGVWLIIVVLSVMNGFEQTWREEILGDRAHFVVEAEQGAIADWPAVLERVRGVPGVVAASPYLDVDAMLRGRGGEITSLRLRGIEPALVGDVTRLRERIVAGSLDALADAPAEERAAATGDDGEPALPGVVVGSALAASLGLGLGDELLVISPFGGAPTPLGPSPRLARFRIVGLFRASAYQVDEVYAYTALAAAQAFRRAGPVIDGIEAITTDYYRSQAVGRAVVDALGEGYGVRDWKEYFPAFFQALETERVMMAVLLTMIMVVAAFIIVATLVMMIMEKSGDIAILKAMGAEDELVERIFALEGTMIGLLGTGLGVLAALAVTHRLDWIQDRIETLTGVDALPAAVSPLASLPSRVDPLQVAVVVTIALVLSLGATLLPSWQGARIDPAEGLRHE